MNKKICKQFLDYHRDEYEQFMGVSSLDKSYKLFSLEQQQMRYAKHISFWYMKRDEIKNSNNNNIEQLHFLQVQIYESLKNLKQMFPNDVIEQIMKIIIDTRKIHNHIIGGLNAS